MKTIPTIMRPLEQEMGDFVTEFWLIRQWGRKLSKSLRLTRVEMRQLGGSGHLGERSVKACLAHISHFATTAFEYWRLQLHVGKILVSPMQWYKVVMLKCQCGESSPPPSSPQVRVGATSVAVCHLHRARKSAQRLR